MGRQEEEIKCENAALVSWRLCVSKIIGKIDNKRLYEFRHSELDWSRPITIETPYITVNRWGFFLADKKLRGLSRVGAYLVLTKTEQERLVKLGEVL